ncbi:MAG TPA: helix-turn-helix domain-containing protein [Gemmatales bacterium]|nr:helix-turn-helix domain-containing protein [Gemmatales bacterium]
MPHHALGFSRLETIYQAAKRIPSARSASGHVSVNVVRRWVHTGKLRRHYHCGQLMVDRAEVDALLARRSENNVSVPAAEERWNRLMVNRSLEVLLSSSKNAINEIRSKE